MSVMKKFMFIRNHLPFASYSLKWGCELESRGDVWTFALDVYLIWSECLLSAAIALFGMS